MIRRDGESEFVKNLDVSRRGNIKVAAKDKGEKGADTLDEAHNVLKKFDDSPDVPDDHIKEHKDRLEKGHNPKEVMSDFFQGLDEAKDKKATLDIKTAKAFRQAGIFKKAEKDVYQDLETGDFWKISEDKKKIQRMFTENEGVAEGI